jgi:hypothetical protein
MESAPGTQIPGKVRLEGQSGDRRIPDIFLFIVDVEIILVTAVTKGGVGKQLIAEGMIPPECAGHIIPAHPGGGIAGFVCLTEMIIPVKEGHVKTVVGIQFEIDLGVYIIKQDIK